MRSEVGGSITVMGVGVMALGIAHPVAGARQIAQSTGAAGKLAAGGRPCCKVSA